MFWTPFFIVLHQSFQHYIKAIFLMKKTGIAIILLTLFLQSAQAELHPLAAKFGQAGLVDVQSIDASIQVNLVNSTPAYNYFREDYYQGLDRAFLRKPVAIKLAKAQRLLKSRHPDYSLLIMDAARPRSVSRKMFEKMQGTPFEPYVANPKKGSMHNYGIAVDISIINRAGEQIDMGFTPFYKNDLQIYWQFWLMKLGIELSDEQKKNRRLLSDIMQQAGFIPLSFEWWHFNGMKKARARKRYRIIE